MELSALQVFAEVMRRGSFARVARARGVAASSISRVISALEDELGVRLFQRTTRRLAPTEAGRTYFEQIEPLLEDLDRARLMAADLGQRPTGTLRLTIPVTFGQMVIVPLLPALAARHPELGIDVVMSDAMVDLLGERIDVAVRLGRLPDSGFTAQRLCELRFAVCASPEYLDRRGRPRAPSELAEHDCLVFSMGGYRSRWRFRGPGSGPGDDEQEVIVSGRVSLSNASSLRQCAAAGMGPVLLPRWVVAEDLRRGALVELFPDREVTATDFDSAAWLLYPSRQYLPRKVRVFVDFLKQVFDDGPPWERGEVAAAGR
ncbi:LysR family transcriptional regulator [Haliangium sp.]|uniref:LysR family transcriptional regulator n=1 Tax=Haliangium sp. TaxID=2663208 RepID=UPI003D10B4C9